MERAQHTAEFLKSRGLDEREFKKADEVEFFNPPPERVTVAEHPSFKEETDILQSEVVHGKEVDFSNENVHPENHPKFPQWRKIVLKVGIGVTTFGVVAFFTPIPGGFIIIPIGVGIMTIAVGKKHAGRHFKSIFIKTKESVVRNWKKVFGRKNKQVIVEEG